MFSYRNIGYAVLGRLIEVLAPRRPALRPGDTAVLRTVATNAHEAILHCAAVGHELTDGTLTPVTTWALPYSNAPAGSQPAMSARDLLTFIGPYLTEPPHLGTPAWGLGWTFHGDNVVGHTGITLSQKALLRSFLRRRRGRHAD